VKKLLIIGLLLMVLLTGCGTFNLFPWVIPDDLEFITVVAELDTPQKICDYLKDNFTFTVHYLYAPSPYCFWLAKEGDCNDFADFGRFVAHQHGYETYKLMISFKYTIIGHAMTIYVQDGKYDYQNVKRLYTIQADTFREVMEDFESYTTKWSIKSYKVYDWDNHLIEKGDM